MEPLNNEMIGKIEVKIAQGRVKIFLKVIALLAVFSLFIYLFIILEPSTQRVSSHQDID